MPQKLDGISYLVIGYVSYNISWKSASISIGGKGNSTLTMSFDTIDLLWSWRDYIITNGLSNYAHMIGGSVEAQTTDA